MIQHICTFFQGTEVDGQKLKIKFPDNPLSAQNNMMGNLTIRKPVATQKSGQG